MFIKIKHALVLAFSFLPHLAFAADFRPVDQPSPALTLKDIDGTMHALSDYKGKVVLVNFWASWCPPCREEMPSIQRLKTTLADRPFAILGIDSGEDLSDSSAFLARMKVDFTILPDAEAIATRQWKVYALPTSFLIDKQGHVRYVLTGPTEWDQGEALTHLNELLNQ